MALFPEINAYYKGRTHTSLVISEGVAPAEKFIPASTEAVKFQYAYGPEGNQNVVIPKGKIVTLGGLEFDEEVGHNAPTLKICDATSIPIGVNHHNVYERRRDRFSGNFPTVITREYIEVPLFTNADDAAAIKFGAGIVASDDLATCMGKFVKSDANGNFVLADTSSVNYSLILGQVLAIETDVPPAGFLQYFLEMKDNEYTEFLKQMSYAPTPGKTSSQGTYDVGTYPLGTGYLETPNKMRDWTKGLPRLTDGYFRARTNVTGITLDGIDPTTMDATQATALETGTAYASTDEQYGQVIDVKTSGNVTVSAKGIVTVTSDVRGAALFIRLKDKLVIDALKSGDTNTYPEFSGANPSDVKVYLRTDGGATFTDTQVSPSNIHVDYTNNMIVVYFTAAVAGAKLLIDATQLIGATPGIPTGWDFKGAVGAVRILLQK